jgi:hypothetical protein
MDILKCSLCLTAQARCLSTCAATPSVWFEFEFFLFPYTIATGKNWCSSMCMCGLWRKSLGYSLPCTPYSWYLECSCSQPLQYNLFHWVSGCKVFLKVSRKLCTSHLIDHIPLICSYLIAIQHVSGIIFVIHCKTNIAFQFNIEAISDAYNDLCIEEEDTTFFSSTHTSSLSNK